MYEVNQIVYGKRCGSFMILALRSMQGEEGAQVKEVNPDNISETRSGEFWLPLSALLAADPGQKNAKKEMEMANTSKVVEVPQLDVDARMKSRFGEDVDADGRLERSIVAHLIAHIEAAGFALSHVYDGEVRTNCSTAKDAMEEIFNLTEVSLCFAKPGYKVHGVLLIPGNGIDIVSDWNWSSGDADGFNAAMDTFDADVIAQQLAA